jgi:hypothetical protein
LDLHIDPALTAAFAGIPKEVAMKAIAMREPTCFFIEAMLLRLIGNASLTY